MTRHWGGPGLARVEPGPTLKPLTSAATPSPSDLARVDNAVVPTMGDRPVELLPRRMPFAAHAVLPREPAQLTHEIKH